MKRAVSILALIVVGLGCCSAASPEPYYCWLAFGPSGKVRVLVRLEGDAVVLQRRMGEQADGKEERFDTLKDCKDVAVKDPDGKTTYVIRSIFDLELVRTLGKGVEVAVDIKGAVGYRQAGRVQMARRPENAPVVHFHAPLTGGPAEDMRNAKGMLVWKPPADLHLVKGSEPSELHVSVRNKTSERGSYVVVVTTDETGKKCLFPDGVRPFVDVEFPPSEPGAKPVKRRYALDGFC